MDFASELNVYLLLVRAVYNFVRDGGRSEAEFATTCDHINQVFEDSTKVDQATKTEMRQML